MEIIWAIEDGGGRDGADGGLWRRVLMPENFSLGDLHEVIQVLFEWDDGHLQLFETSKRRYADPFHGLNDCGDE